MKQPKVKGVAFRTIGLCYTELRGQESFERALALMPPEISDGYRYHTLLASSWYPIEHYCEVFRAFRAVRSDGPELARAIGKLAARHDMSGVHKQILARLISPQALLSMSQRVFNTYYDTGKFDLLESRKGFVHCMFRACLGFDESMWAEVAGSCESLLEIAGAENVRIRPIAGAGSGDSSAEFEARWT